MFIPFLKMLNVGVPKNAVQLKMQNKGLDPKILDMDINKPPPMDATAVDEKPKIKKVEITERWKKFHWQKVTHNLGTLYVIQVRKYLPQSISIPL